MIINGNDKAGSAKVYLSAREMQLEKQVKNLELKVKRKYYRGMPKEVRKEIEELKKFLNKAVGKIECLYPDIIDGSCACSNCEFVRDCNNKEWCF